MSFDPLRACQLLARRLILEEEFSPLAAILPGMEDLSASVEASVARPVSGSVEVIAMATVEVGGRGPDDIEQLARDLRQRAESLAPRVKGRLIICLVLVTEQGLPTWLESVLKNLPEDTLTSKVRLGSAWCSLGGEARAFGHMEPPPGLNWYATSLADPNMPDRAQVERHLYEREREQRQLRAWLRPGPTWITFGLIASNVGYFFLHGNAVETFQKQGMSLAEASNAAYLMLGINNKLLVFDQGEYWRLLASTFLHGGQLHLAFNMMALYSLGGFFEKLAGPLRYLALYLVCGVLASLGSISANPAETYSLGASGAVLGLAGALMTLKWRPLKHFPPEVGIRIYESLKKSILFILVLGFALGMMKNIGLLIDNWAHVAGLVSGAAFMLLFPPRMRDFKR